MMRAVLLCAAMLGVAAEETVEATGPKGTVIEKYPNGEELPQDLFVMRTREGEEGCVGVRNGDRVGISHQGYVAGGPQDGRLMDQNPQGEWLYIDVGKGLVLKGMELAMLGMCEGEQREVIMHPRLAFDAPNFKSSSAKTPVGPGTSVRYVINVETIQPATILDSARPGLVLFLFLCAIGVGLWFLGKLNKHIMDANEKKKKPGKSARKEAKKQKQG
eukprot:Hpha_TRINITY_DN9949_c0_g1::TRINITY_DN9949_c0_g1_i1::g.140328::m.140328